MEPSFAPVLGLASLLLGFYALYWAWAQGVVTQRREMESAKLARCVSVIVLVATLACAFMAGRVSVG